MSSLIINMVAKNELSMEELIENIKKRVNGNFITNIEHKFSDSQSTIIVFEKFYFRTSSYANLCIMLSKTESEIYADIIGSGGGSGIFNISWGTNTDFAEKAEEVLKDLGFIKLEKKKVE